MMCGMTHFWKGLRLDYFVSFVPVLLADYFFAKTV